MSDTATHSDSLPIADRAATRAAARRVIRDDPRGARIAAVMTVVQSAVLVLTPLVIGKLIDSMRHDPSVASVNRFALLLAVIGIAELLITRFAGLNLFRYSERILERLRNLFVDRTLALPPATVERIGHGDLMTRSSTDISTIGMTVHQGVPNVLYGSAELIFIFVALLVLSPVMTLFALTALPFIYLAMRWYLRRARDAYLAEGAARSAASDAMAITVEGSRTVETLQLKGFRERSAVATGNVARLAGLRTLFLRSVLFPTTDIASRIATAALLIGGGILYSNGWVSLGTVAAAALYGRQMMDPVEEIIMWQEVVQRGTAAFARVEGINELLADAPELTTAPTPRGPQDGSVRVSGVRYHYAGGADVLHDINLVVPRGERLAIVGASGAGKSTLGRLLAGVDSPTGGTVLVDGCDVVGMTPEARRDYVLMVTQEHHVFMGTVRDNLVIALPDAAVPDSDAVLERALRAVGAWDWVHRLEHGLDTVVGSGGVGLDAAHEQQLALARVVLADPGVVVLDEATALLDPQTARSAETSMNAVMSGRTVIAIAHRLHTAHDADRIAVMEGGRIAELGTHEELVGQNGHYARLWRSWQV